jgi:hypothetical protein
MVCELLRQLYQLCVGHDDEQPETRTTGNDRTPDRSCSSRS